MKNLYTIILLALVVFVSLPSIAQYTELDCRFYELYKKGDMRTWNLVVDSLYSERLSLSHDYTLLLAEYGLIGYHLSQGERKEASRLLKRFEKHLEKRMKSEPQSANLHALNSAMLGFKIGVKPWLAPFVNSDQNDAIANALDYRKNEAMPLVEKANSLYFRPSFVGGDRDKSVGVYEQAFEILEKEKTCNWVYLNIGSWLGQVYTKYEQPQKAKQIYLKLLEDAPDFKYVKDELLPQLESGQFIDITNKLEKQYKQ
ncbi:MAG: hypothetical protein PF436_04775 [Prolixibacteraceae bacterium]|jgi:tetratricopeptide (TPR) repeat protein|nr:hypothetical protein [Prolixibacteraceae bacterium]